MDISSLKTSERVIEITDPRNGDNLGIKVSIVAINDPRLKKLKRKITDERLRLEARGKNFKAGDVEENMNAILYTAMTGWVWEKGSDFNGSVPEFTRENVFAVFEALPWFMNQIDEAVGDEKAFF